MKSSFDSIIIGAGVSGMTASLYLKRAGVKFLLIEQNYPGGQINRADIVKNYPGVLSIDGPSLVMNMVQQLNELEIEVSYEKVLEIKNFGAQKEVITNKNIYQTKTILLASGRVPRELGLENEKDLIGKGISWCASCDGIFYKNKDVAVIGGGNTAISDALYLSKICNKVYVVHRSEKFRADNILLESSKNKDNIEFVTNRNVKSLIIKNSKLEGILLDNDKKLIISGLFEAIGSIPNIDYLKDLSIKNDQGYIVVDENMKTSIDGIYASGDAIKKELYQIVTATGEGAKAADAIIKHISLLEKE